MSVTGGMDDGGVIDIEKTINASTRRDGGTSLAAYAKSRVNLLSGLIDGMRGAAFRTDQVGSTGGQCNNTSRRRIESCCFNNIERVMRFHGQPQRWFNE